MKRSLQSDEAARLEVLRAYAILDTPPTPGLENITSLVTRLFGVPMAAVTLVDARRQWFKSKRGLEFSETPSELSFCARAMWSDGVVVVPDLTLDPRFADNPQVTGEMGLRFYASAPLRGPEGYPLGTLCVMDRKPRQLSPTEQQMLVELATLVEDELLLCRVGKELRTETSQREPMTEALPHRRQTLPPQEFSAEVDDPARGSTARQPAAPAPGVRSRRIVEQASDAIFIYDLEGRFVDVNVAACKMVGYEREELLRLGVEDIEVSFEPIKGPKRWREMAPGEAVTMEGLNRRKGGGVFPGESRVSVVETDDGGRLLLALVRDTTERKQAERLLQVRARQQQAVATLGAKALAGAAVDALLDEAVAIIGGILELEICRALEFVPDVGQLVFRSGLDLPDLQRGQPAITDRAKSASAHVLRTGESVIIKDIRADTRFELSPWLRASDAVSGLSVPIGGGTDAPRYGILAAYTKKPREFSEDDVYFVQSVANVLAAAIARQRGEDALRVVETRYRRIAARTPGVVYQYRINKDGTVAIPFISEGCRMLYGLEPRAVQENPQIMLDRIHPDDLPGLVAAMHTAETTLAPMHWQGRQFSPSGEVLWVRFDSRPERQPDGGVICDGIIIDITAEEKRKEALRQSEERFRLANVHSPFPVMLHAEGGEVIQVNDAWTQRTGYAPRQLTTLEDWLALAHAAPEARETVRRHLATLSEHIGAVEFPGQTIRCADGQERIWDFSCANLGRLPDGRYLYVTTAIDVTERQHSETALRLAKEEAERANSAKSRFLSRMSHELRTPLNAILGFGQLLELSQLAEQDARSVRYILTGGRHLLSLVDEVLDLARVESGELTVKLSAVSLDKLSQECAGFVARMGQTRGISCLVEVCPACLVPVRADEQRLRQVLLNLLSNAIKYNRVGGQVSLGCEQMESGWIRLRVRDTGVGISPDGLARLFVPFERLGQEFGEVEGSGLGLVVSKQLVEAMGGRMGVESEVDVGSTFWVDLPPAAIVSPMGVADGGVAGSSGTASGDHPSATLLYIEDNPSNVQVVKMVFDRLRPHWQFLSVGDGPGGLECARERRPSLILLDLQLPGMHGDTVLVELRADPRTRHIPVLLLSADATSHSRERLRALGANDYLPKPFNITDLLSKIDSLLLAQ